MFSSLCVEGRLREMTALCFPFGQEKDCQHLPVTIPMLCPSSAGSSQLWLLTSPFSCVFRGGTCFFQCLHLLWSCFLTVVVALPPLFNVHRERCWQFIRVLHKNYTHAHSCPTVGRHSPVSASTEVSVAQVAEYSTGFFVTCLPSRATWE